MAGKNNNQNNQTNGIEFNEIKPKTPNQHLLVKSILEDIVTICDGPAGSGKAQPLDSIIYTPSGPKYLGDLKKNDDVCTPDGKISKIIDIYPQGYKEIFKIEFKQGYNVECCKDHLWEVSHCNWGYRKKILSTQELLYYYDKISYKSHRFVIDVSKPVSFQEKKTYIHPYILGCLIGDGCFSQKCIEFSNTNLDILKKITDLLIDQYTLSPIKNSKCGYRLVGYKRQNKYIAELSKYGLLGKKSNNKFIPENYLFNSIENRKELLAGLLDTDGSIHANTIEYTTVSHILAEQIIELCHSLGGICKKTQRYTYFTYKGKKTRST